MGPISVSPLINKGAPPPGVRRGAPARRALGASLLLWYGVALMYPQGTTMANDLDATFKFRLPADLLKAFNLTCEDNDQTAAQVLRAAVREYVTRNAKPQGDLLKPVRSKAK